MNIVMDMSSYSQEVPDCGAATDESLVWSDDYLPGLALNSMPSSQAAKLQGKSLLSSKMPCDLVTQDVELFLQRIYTYQPYQR